MASPPQKRLRETQLGRRLANAHECIEAAEESCGEKFAAEQKRAVAEMDADNDLPDLEENYSDEGKRSWWRQVIAERARGEWDPEKPRRADGRSYSPKEGQKYHTHYCMAPGCGKELHWNHDIKPRIEESMSTRRALKQKGITWLDVRNMELCQECHDIMSRNMGAHPHHNTKRSLWVFFGNKEKRLI